LGRYEQAIETGERAYTIAGEVGDARLKAIAGMELGWQHMRAGNFHRAEALFNQVVAELDSSAASRGLPDQEWMRRFSLEGLVETLTFLGRYGEAVDLGEEAVRMAHDLGHAAPIAATLFRLGRAHASLGNVTTAIDLGNRSLTISRERNVLSTLQYALACLGMSYTLAGRSEEAVARLEEAVAAGESQKSLDAFTVAMLGHAYLSAGRQDDAHRSAHHALSMSRKTRPSIEAIALHLLGEIATRRSPSAIDVAAQHFRRALALATTLGMRPLAAHCHLSLGKLYRLTGKQDQAQQNLTTATTMYREMDMTYWLEQAEAELKACT
jgi:tetratricopeptide (TPR) repeat protein